MHRISIFLFFLSLALTSRVLSDEPSVKPTGIIVPEPTKATVAEDGIAIDVNLGTFALFDLPNLIVIVKPNDIEVPTYKWIVNSAYVQAQQLINLKLKTETYEEVNTTWTPLKGFIGPENPKVGYSPLAKNLLATGLVEPRTEYFLSGYVSKPFSEYYYSGTPRITIPYSELTTEELADLILGNSYLLICSVVGLGYLLPVSVPSQE